MLAKSSGLGGPTRPAWAPTRTELASTPWRWMPFVALSSSPRWLASALQLHQLPRARLVFEDAPMTLRTACFAEVELMLIRSVCKALAPETPAAALECSCFPAPGTEDLVKQVFESWDQMPTVPTLFDVRPVGPPLLVSFGCYISLAAAA